MRDPTDMILIFAFRLATAQITIHRGDFSLGSSRPDDGVMGMVSPC